MVDFVERIKKLYLQDPRCASNFEEKSNDRNLDMVFNLLSNTDVERVMDLDFSKGKRKVIELLRYVPPELILKEFGEEMGCWMFLHNPESSSYYFQLERMVKDSPQGDELIDTCLQLRTFTESKTEYFLREAGAFLKGKDATAVKKAIRIANTFDCRDKLLFIQQNYFLIEGLLQQNIVQQIDWRQLLENQFRQNIPHWKSRLDQYSLENLFVDIGFDGSDPRWADVEQKNTGMRYQIYLDAPLGILLKYKEEPQAVVAFTPINKKTIKIYQIQGVVPKKFDEEENVVARGNSRGLSSVDWQAFFIDVVSNLAERYNFREIAIQSGHNNDWTRLSDEKKVHLQLENALQRYDAVAQRLEFVQREDKNWYKKIE